MSLTAPETRTDDLVRFICRVAVFAAVLLVFFQSLTEGLSILENVKDNHWMRILGWLRVAAGFAIAAALIRDHLLGYLGYVLMIGFNLVVIFPELQLSVLAYAPYRLDEILPFVQVLAGGVLFVLVAVDLLVYRQQRG